MESLFGDEERLFADEPPTDGSSPTSPAGDELADAPLAARMRPTSLGEFVGQRELLAPGSALRTAIEHGRPHSMILHGPPGSGKTTLARIIANAADAAFEEESAVAAGRAEVRAVIERARQRRRVGSRAGRDGRGQPTIFFLDEIHRFNKAQQDALLPAVEDGLITLIGATTENPYFEVNSALLSRTRVYELQALSPDDVLVVLERAVSTGQCGAGQTVAPDALRFAAEWTGGDARAALGGLELACETAGENGTVSVAHIRDALQQRALAYDRQADNHYDTISAWIKATRGSDPDASLYYLAVMLEGGEDPRFIVRRMVILASEDIGNADPQALGVATAAAAAVDRIGLPECQFALAQAAVYLALAPKSDAAKRAMSAARAHVRDHGSQPPPQPLRSSTRSDGNYDNPHRHPGHVSTQELAPDGVVGVRFYQPDQAEEALRERLEQIRRRRAGG